MDNFEAFFAGTRGNGEQSLEPRPMTSVDWSDIPPRLRQVPGATLRSQSSAFRAWSEPYIEGVVTGDEGGTMAMTIPPVLKPVTQYVRRAEKLDRAQEAEAPVVAYYCRLYATDQAMNLNDNSQEA